MAERRKIIIETGANPDEPLPTPHFDAEATLTARPVIPLTDQENYQRHYGGYASGVAKPFWRRPALLALIVLVAVGVGVAAGLAIGIYRNRQATNAPVATAPSSNAEDASADEIVEQPQPAPTTQEARAAVPEEREEPPVEPKEEEPSTESRDEARERTARNERKDDDDDERQPAEARQPVIRNKRPVKVDEYIIEDGRAGRQVDREERREERRAERRERRRRQRDEEVNIPRGVERGAREVDRIREIFEGRQP